MGQMQTIGFLSRTFGNVARIVLECCDTNRDDSTGSHVGIIEGLPVHEFWSILGRNFGYNIEPLSQEEWLDAIYADIDSKHEKHPLWPLIHNLEKEHGKNGYAMDEIPEELKVGTPSSRVEAAIVKMLSTYVELAFSLQQKYALILSVK
ncbi:hypothetical protein DID88_006862 [Monilinia fructigena]|uniref:Uncharacterized protein n=1 Tax=Monilinia fructigena TaxID=38457 RepID=A0A395IGC6_9HELO|nr:hypothetical protein DID88_006862 [Monilinia fructigena]